MNISLKKTNNLHYSHAFTSSNTPTKRFQVPSPSMVISNAKNELNLGLKDSAFQKKISFVSNSVFMKSIKSPLTASELHGQNSFESGLEKIKEENCLKLEKKQRRNTDEILNKKPMNLFGKEVILEKINLEERVRRMRQKTDLKTNEMSTKIEDNINISNLNQQKSFRIRNKRSISDARINEKEKGNQKTLILENKNAYYPVSNNKQLLKGKLQKRPDTTGAKNREKFKEKLFDNFQNEKKIVKNSEFFKKKDVEIKKNIIIEKKSEISDFNKNQIEYNSEICNDLSELKFGELLGEGAYAQVYKVLVPKTGNFIAVKVIKLIKSSEEYFSEQLKNLTNELQLLKQLSHENIVSYLGCKISPEKQNFFIFMEHMPGGSIASMLKQYGSFNEQVIKKFVKQLLNGLIFLHSKRIVHSDLKGANILSDGNGNIKLADFGASKHLENLSLLSASGSDFNKSAKGSLYWMAPEILNQETHGRKVDIWSLGCTIIEMATSNHPWSDCKSFTELVVQVMTKKCPPIPQNLSEECKDFISQCCIFERKKRPSANELFAHKFLHC